MGVDYATAGYLECCVDYGEIDVVAVVKVAVVYWVGSCSTTRAGEIEV